MLVHAKIKEDELLKKFPMLLANPERFKWMFQGNYSSMFEIGNDTYNHLQYASVDAKGNVIGFIQGDKDGLNHYINNIGSVKFEPSSDPCFFNDMIRFRKMMFDTFRFQKIMYSTIADDENPAYQKLKMLTKMFNGSLCGYYVDHVTLCDGSVRSVIEWTVTEKEYKASAAYALLDVDNMPIKGVI